MQDGDYNAAYEAFKEIEGYKDSTTLEMKALMQVTNVGDTISFGSYEQDSLTKNGKEEIEWIVLAKEDNRMFVISKYILDVQPFNTTESEYTWDKCSLRNWLNVSFLKDAFTDEEQEMIEKTKVTADLYPGEESIPQGKTTTDKIFLLSFSEVLKYLKSNRGSEPTYYAKDKGARGWWYLRTHGASDPPCAVVMEDDGTLSGILGYVTNDDIGVRPALWIKQ